MKPYIPRGCDQQGRYPEAAEAPAPAEAATEIDRMTEVAAARAARSAR